MNEQVRQFVASRGYKKTLKQMQTPSVEEEGLFGKFAKYKRSRKSQIKSKLSFEVSYFCIKIKLKLQINLGEDDDQMTRSVVFNETKEWFAASIF